MSMLFTTVPGKRLAESINASSSSIQLNNIKGWDGNDLTSSDFGTRLFAVLRNDSNTAMEIMELDPATIASSSITILARGLKFTGDLSTQVTANKLTWVKNVTIVELGTDVPQLLNHMVQVIGDQTVAGIKTFSSLPATSAGNPVADNDLARKAYVDAAAIGGATNIRLVVQGVGGEVLTAGNLVYLDVADTKWKKCDADTAALVENVLLGIAQGAGTNGGAITGGVLLFGVDANQSGLTLNSVYYASNTAGGISASVGTKEVTVGYSKSATELYFYPRVNQQLTEDQQDALVGSSGTPSDSNKYVTEADVSSAAASGKIVRASGTTLPALGGENLTGIVSGYYGDGAQGDLSTTGATTFNSTKTAVDQASAAAQPNIYVTSTTGIVAGDHILIWQTKHATSMGLWEIAKVSSVVTNDYLVLTANLRNSYEATGAQVVLMPEYGQVRLKSGTTVSDSAWNGSTNGVIAFYASKGVIIDTGVTISMSAKGLRGATAVTDTIADGKAGEGTGANFDTVQVTRNGTGGGGGRGASGGSEASGGGGFLTAGENGLLTSQGGNSALTDLTSYYSILQDVNFLRIIPGSGGGSGGPNSATTVTTGAGGIGGGVIMIIAPFIINLGTVTVAGQNGTSSANGDGGGGGGGMVMFFSPDIINTSVPTVSGGAGPSSAGAGGDGFYIGGYPQGLPRA